jgi:hypothetical protein
MQKGKRQIDPSTYNNSDIDSLSEKVLDMPLKKSKEIKEILKLRAEEHKILQQMNSKLSHSTLPTPATNRSKPVSALQQ